MPVCIKKKKSLIQSSQTFIDTCLHVRSFPQPCKFPFRKWENTGGRMLGRERWDWKGSVRFLFYCLLWATWEPNQGAAGGVWERRGVPVRGLASQAFKDIRIRQLIYVFHVREPRRWQLESSSQAPLGLHCSCFAFPITGPVLAVIHGLLSPAVQGHGLSGFLVVDGLRSVLPHFSTAHCLPPFPKVASFPENCPLDKPSLPVKPTTLLWSFLWQS